MIKLIKIFIILILLVVVVGFYNLNKPLPKDLSMSGQIFNIPDDSIEFLSDLTYLDSNLESKSDQEIFDEIFEIVDRAENFILIDMFLYNDFMGKEDTAYKTLSSQLTQKLIENKKENSALDIVVVTDPINTIYGGIESDNLNKLQESGVLVVKTDLRRLRDSNPIYSSVWRSFFKFLPVGFIKLPNPFIEQGPKVGLDSYLELLNFKANHRKVIIADYLDENNVLKVTSLVTSANPHDGSSRHSNVAVKIDNFIWQDILKSELAVIDFSDDLDFDVDYDLYKDETGNVKVQLLTEQQIKESLLDSINQTDDGDNIKILMFYLSERDIVKSLKSAYDRGVDLEIILDPNKDAFGRSKNGVPNVSVAKELKKHNNDFKIRWCDTNGEQCHGKMIIIQHREEQQLFIGSANLTRRNVDDYNLETNVKIWGESVLAIDEALEYFDKVWENDLGQYSVEYDVYKDESLLKYIQYIFMEKTGISSF